MLLDSDVSLILSLGATQGLLLVAFLTSGQLRKAGHLSQGSSQRPKQTSGWVILPWEALLGEESEGKPH